MTTVSSLLTIALTSVVYTQVETQTESDLEALRPGLTTPRDCSTEVVLLKAAGSPLWWSGRGYDGGGTMSALVVRGRVYLVDLADGIGARFTEAGLGGDPLSQNIANLRGIFITHMNNDHLAGLPTILSQGSAQQTPPEGRIKIIGPYPNGLGRDGIVGVWEPGTAGQGR